MLDLSKVEANKMDLFAEDVDLAPFLRDTSGTVDTLIQRKSNRLVGELGKTLGTMHTDTVKLRQCLFNLLSNAAKFTDNGTITLTAHRETTSDGDWVAFAVRDTGIGIADSDEVAPCFRDDGAPGFRDDVAPCRQGPAGFSGVRSFGVERQA